jgi:hypothetical protein
MGLLLEVAGHPAERECIHYGERKEENKYPEECPVLHEFRILVRSLFGAANIADIHLLLVECSWIKREEEGFRA